MLSDKFVENWVERAMERMALKQQPVCPYCGEKDGGNQELGIMHLSDQNDEVHETECGRCGKMFRFKIHVTEDYDSFPMEEETDD